MLTLNIWGNIWEERQHLAVLCFTKDIAKAWSEQLAGWQGRAVGMFWNILEHFFHGCQVKYKTRLTDDI